MADKENIMRSLVATMFVHSAWTNCIILCHAICYLTNKEYCFGISKSMIVFNGRKMSSNDTKTFIIILLNFFSIDLVIK